MPLQRSCSSKDRATAHAPPAPLYIAYLCIPLPPLPMKAVVVDEATGEVVRGRADGGRLLGYHPDSGLPVVLKPGPYGPYLELEGSVAAEAAALELAAAAAVDSQAGGEAEGAGSGAEVAEAGEAEAKPKKRGRKRKQPAAVPKVKPRRATVPKVGGEGQGVA